MLGDSSLQSVMSCIHDDSISPIDKYMQLRQLQGHNPIAFYQSLMSHTEELLPYLYTPTVGEACQKYHLLPIPTYGLYLRATDRHTFLQKLQSLPNQNISVVVVTDGERILGLGDLGANGMGISEGKSLLYTAAGGVQPSYILPVCLDVGTNNKSLLKDPLYKGLHQPRLTGAAYDALVEEFIKALQAWRPHVVLQFEDFANHNAFVLLERYRRQICCFNDDVQGTACITLAGLLAAVRAINYESKDNSVSLADQTVLFLGAGEAGTGIAELIAIALESRHGMTRRQGRQRCYFMDSKGLVCASRNDLQPHKKAFAHNVPFCRTLVEAVKVLRPTALIGVSTSRGAFTPEILNLMADYNSRPIIFPLSNPTSKSECTYEEAFNATKGQVLFASGSPFPHLVSDRRGATKITYTPAQANNAYVFPAIGHAAALCKATQITNHVFLLAAEALAEMTMPEEIEHGRLFPSFSNIHKVSCHLIATIGEYMVASGLGEVPKDLHSFVQGGMALKETGEKPTRAEWEAYAWKHMYKAPQASSRL